MASLAEGQREKSQYQHYLPQTILRRFSNYVEPNREDYANKKAFDHAVSAAKKKASVKVLNLQDGFEKAHLETRKVHKTGGILDMYDLEIEERLGQLEQQAIQIIRVIEQNFTQGQPNVQLTRAEKDLLRRFVFIMQYRNRTFYGRYEKSAEDYDANDREHMLAYIREQGFANPKEVWLRNIRAFLDVELGHDDGRWGQELKRKAYPDDAEWFHHRLTASFLCFCTPLETDSEFLLTQNAYSVYEGPTEHELWMDWHTFALINPRLIIVLRSTFLEEFPGHPPTYGPALKAFNQAVVKNCCSMYDNPTQASSWLEDLPVARPATSYSTVRPSHKFKRCRNRSANVFSADDVFTFTFFAIPEKHVQVINSIFLEHAISTQAIYYPSRVGLRKALESYLRLDVPGMKSVFVRPAQTSLQAEFIVDHWGATRAPDHPDCLREAYLKLLEKICAELGSTVPAKFNTIGANSTEREILPTLPPIFADRYRKLGGKLDGGEEDLASFLEDVDQARRIFLLRILTKSAMKGKSSRLNHDMIHARHELIGGLDPRRVWLYVRYWRLQSNFFDVSTLDTNTEMRALVADANHGPEDVPVDGEDAFRMLKERGMLANPQNPAAAVIRPACFARLLASAGLMSDYLAANSHSVPTEEHVVAALQMVGYITDCGVSRLEDEARSLRTELEMHSGPAVEELQRLLVQSSAPPDLWLEMYIRYDLHARFEELLGAQLGADLLGRLKDVVFGLLYPLHPL